MLEIRNKRNCTIYVAKTKALISCMVKAQLICIFVFAYVKSRFSHNMAVMRTLIRVNCLLISSPEPKAKGELIVYR